MPNSVMPAPGRHQTTSDGIPCPPWCPLTHTGEVTEVDGFTLSQSHELVLAEITAADPAYLRQPATVTVMLEAVTEAGTVTMPDRIVVTVADGPQGSHPGEPGTQAWTGTRAQARALAYAILRATDLATEDQIRGYLLRELATDTPTFEVIDWRLSPADEVTR